MRISVECAVTHLCPYVDERDLGTLRATWEGNVEFYTLAHRLSAWSDKSATHEEMTASIARSIAELGGACVLVTTTWRTAGFDVTVTAP